MADLSRDLSKVFSDRVKAGISLLLISFLGLYYELAFIRWLPANIASLAFFSNVVLISCFLGIGLGCLLASRRDLFHWFPPMLLCAVAAYLFFQRLEIFMTDEGNEWIWSGYQGKEATAGKIHLGILPTLVIVYLLNTALFIPIGQKMGKLMEEFKPIEAYSINITGSVMGVVVFAAFSYAGGYLNSPELWFAVGGLITLWFFRSSKRHFVIGAICLLVACLFISRSSANQIWSPYYSIQLRPGANKSLMLYVNRFYHQRAIDFSAEPAAAAKYGVSYRKKVPQKVLILGAGTGNDVIVANMNGVASIDAVEIDPSIVMLGRELHPSHAYDASNVHVIVDDARSYLRRTGQRYDMIIFGTLDSHALLSGMSTIRLDNFVYTVECLLDVKRCLKPDGVAVLMFSVQRDWIKDKLMAMCVRVFPQPRPLFWMSRDDLSYNFMMVAGPGLNSYMGVQEGFQVIQATDQVNVPSDDWPYLYLRDRIVPGHYLKAIAILSVISALAVYLASPKGHGRVDLNFFSLGCAFMLLETKSVTTLSLVFGSTWLVNAFVFGAILVMVLAANLFVLTWRIRNIRLVYLLLGISLLLNFLFPVSSFLGLSYWTRSLLSVLWVAWPMFFAAILFASHFRTVRQIGWVFGSNLVGAVLGGFLEYSSMAVGLNFLYIIAAIFYLVSFLSARIAYDRTGVVT